MVELNGDTSDTIFDLIVAPTLITAPVIFYFIFTYRPLDDLFLDFLKQVKQVNHRNTDVPLRSSLIHCG